MLSKTGLQAVKALAQLAELPEGAYAGAASLAERTGGGANYLGKMLQMLAREGLVISQKGSGGGFRLARHPKEISLFDIVEPIDHIARWNGCFMGRPECSSQSPCAVHHQWATLRDGYLSFLKHTKLSSLAVGGSTTHEGR
ncbi:MAG: Rrf2 family transcriptional regulator [Candidatus Omnitrophica bacterium]|nr:HTH-type transcriptional regulator IscR [bacterium]NUN95358.1 Rrf2 family transcriptional regulator [Candidatus Omnitrophota bacterium]